VEGAGSGNAMKIGEIMRENKTETMRNGKPDLMI